MAALPPAPQPTVTAIYAAYEVAAEDGFRDHLGASLLGKECARALWYDFRWASPARHPGRILRLFDTGRREEERLVRDLRATGAMVLDLDPETGRQWRVETHGGHVAGSLDAVALGILEAPRTWHVVELKTHNAKSFALLQRHGVAGAKPLHWAQMQIYLRLTGMDRALYLAVCKDTDQLWAERIRLDADAADRLLARAARVVDSARPPARLSDDPEFFECRLCDHRDVCHEGEAAPRTCRSCLHSTPLVEGGWHCARWAQPLDRAMQRAGCDRHLFIPDLVPGEPVEAGLDRVVYSMPDGDFWADGPGTAVAAC